MTRKHSKAQKKRAIARIHPMTRAKQTGVKPTKEDWKNYFGQFSRKKRVPGQIGKRGSVGRGLKQLSKLKNLTMNQNRIINKAGKFPNKSQLIHSQINEQQNQINLNRILTKAPKQKYKRMGKKEYKSVYV